MGINDRSYMRGPASEWTPAPRGSRVRDLLEGAVAWACRALLWILAFALLTTGVLCTLLTIMAKGADAPIPWVLGGLVATGLGYALLIHLRDG